MTRWRERLGLTVFFCAGVLAAVVMATGAQDQLWAQATVLGLAAAAVYLIGLT